MIFLRMRLRCGFTIVDKMIVPFISFYLMQRSDMMKIMFGEYFSALDLNQKAGKWWEIFF